MARFDIITAAVNAYQTCWASRRYILRLAAVPVFLKLVCYMIAVRYAGESDGTLLFMLILLPSLFAQGWMLSHFVRFIVLGQTWPFRPTGDVDADRAMLSVRARGVLGGMIVFILVNMGIGLLSDIVLRVMGPYMPLDGPVDPQTIPAFIPVLSIGLFIGMIWGFRFLWLYIPFALNMDVKAYLNAVRGTSGMFSLIGVWVLCFLPFILLMKFVGPVFAALPGDAGDFSIAVLSVVIDTLKTIVVTAGISFGLREIFSTGKGPDLRA